MKKLFEATAIKSLKLQNRFVCSGTWLGLAAPDGSCTPALIERLATLARGGVGLIISEFAFVSRQGQVLANELGVHSDEMLPGLTWMAEGVHAAGSRIVLQLVHGGLYAMAQEGKELWGPSIPKAEKVPMGHEMSRSEIREMKDAFRDGAIRAKKAGFDGVQIHAAHGFIFSQFLSPFFNKRTDEYGGSIENRARIVVETVQSAREAVGDSYPILVKINSEDFLEGGFAPEEMVAAAKMLEEAGVDAFELSGGTVHGFKVGNPDIFFSPVTRVGVYYEEAARRYKQTVDRPLMLVGGIRSLAAAQRLVEEGVADYVSLCRPLIREPDLVKRWESGDARDAQCLSDDACLKPGFEGRGVYCVHQRGYRRRPGLLRFYSGSTGTVNTKRAVVECLEIALGEGNLDCDLLIFYTTMGHNFPNILSEAHRLCPSAEIVGCTCAGVIGREGPNESMRALAVMAVRGPKEAFAVAGVESILGKDPFEVGAKIAHQLKAKNPNITMVLIHPATWDGPPFDGTLRGIESVLGRHVPIFGGLSIDNMKMVSNFQFMGDRVHEQGAVAVGFADPTLELISQANHGFSVIGEPFTVTKSKSNRVYELDGKPCWKALTERLGLSEYAHPMEVVAFAELAEELPPELHEEYGSGYIIRAGGTYRHSDGSCLLTATCPEGTKLWLVKRDEKGIIEGLDRMVESVVRRCGNRRPFAVFHADCAARGKLLFNRILKDEVVSRMQQPLCRGENVPWLGMYGGGEITQLGGQNTIHVFTTSLYVLVEREG